MGRIINHSRNGNLTPKAVKQENLEIPNLYFVASRDIEVGEELLYDYGDRSAKSRKEFPWLA